MKQSFKVSPFTGRVIAVGVNQKTIRQWDLSFAILHGADLSGADLRGVKANITCFNDANLNRASLVGAQLHGARFNGARLKEADMILAHVNGASFFEADLRGACLPKNLRGIDFRLADMSNAYIQFNTDFRGAHFEGACIAGVDLSGAKLAETWGIEFTTHPYTD